MSAAESLILLFLGFGWGFTAAADGGPRTVTANNDSHVRFVSEDAAATAQMRRWVQQQSQGE